MTTPDATTRMERIERDECLRLLAGEELGRLAVIDGRTPVILPVNYLLDGADIVVRTGPGTKLDAAGRGHASFEIDDVDRATRTGWSVVATGRLEEVTRFDARTFERVRALPVDPWAQGAAKDHWLRLVTDHISGRRLRRRDPSADA